MFKFGVKIKKIHTILEFKQEPLSKPHIKHNLVLPRESEKEGNQIKKQNSNLRNNATFHKLIENAMSKVDI